MEIECSKCQRKFHTTREGMSVCPDCLKSEFSTKAMALNAEEREELVAEYKASLKRQSARAEQLGSMYASGKAFSVAGKLRATLGLVIFLICCFLFLVSDKNTGVTFLAELDMESQRLFSMVLCVVAAVLVASASFRYRKLALLAAAVVLAVGWYLPNMLQAALREKAKLEAEAAIKEQQIQQETQPAESEKNGPLLTDADLQVFYALRTPSQRISHYAVFIDNQDSRARSLVREALNRLLEAEYTRAYTRANGALYVATNVPKARRNISDVLTRFGTVTYAEPQKGVYEVRFDADKANLVSQYSSEVLTSPMNNAYVTANLSELRCLDPMRVRMSARSLANSNVRVLRTEIRDTLVEVLREPWSTDPDTYAALIDALVTYSNPRVAQAIKLCYDYFEARRVLSRNVSPEVTHYLIREAPEAMVNPVIDFWCENPIAWGEMLAQLGERVQAPLVQRLSGTKNLRLITSILKYLEDKGTAEARPAVEAYLDYPDSIIRHSARATLDAINSRYN